MADATAADAVSTGAAPQPDLGSDFAAGLLEPVPLSDPLDGAEDLWAQPDHLEVADAAEDDFGFDQMEFFGLM